MMTILINSNESLQHALSCCHDARFEVNNVIFNETEKVFSLKIYRPILEKAVLERKIVFFKTWAIPRIESILSFYNVSKMTLTSEFNSDTILAIKYNLTKHRIIFDCAQNTSIYLMVDKLAGKLKDIGDPFFDGAKFITFLGKELIRCNM